MPPYQPFVLVWTNAPPGTNILLTAEATDNGGASAASDPVRITVHSGPPPAPTNFPPVVRMTSPSPGAVFRGPVDIPVVAYARDPEGRPTSVGFFDGTNFLGFGRAVGPVVPPFPPGPIQPALLVRTADLFVLARTNAPRGCHVLTAVATDGGGAAAVSDPVNITVLPPLAQANTPPVVSIVAIDPVAVAGTNAWPWMGLAAASCTWTNWTATNAVYRYFNRCGPKDALFAVRRHGDLGADLAVGYGIGGTASNGADYVTLPGVVTILAGQPVALISLVPVDDGVTSVTRTVILTLTPPAETPPGYALRFPRKAAAVILDRPDSPPAVGFLPGQCFNVNRTGPDGAWFRVEHSHDLRDWTPVCTNQVVNGMIEFLDPDASGAPARFYRIVPESDPQQE